MNFKQFKTVCKPLPAPTTLLDGLLHETQGSSYDAVEKHQDAGLPVATLVDEEGDWVIRPGYHFANRLGYFLLEAPLNEAITL